MKEYYSMLFNELNEQGETMENYIEHRKIGNHSVSYENDGKLRKLHLSNNAYFFDHVETHEYMLFNEEVVELRDMLNSIAAAAEKEDE